MSRRDKNGDTPLRTAVKKGSDAARGAVGVALEAAKSTAVSVQAATKTADTPVGLAVMKGFEFAKQNISAIFDLTQQLVKAGSLKEATKLQTDFIRTRTSEMVKQAGELRDVVRRPSAGASAGEVEPAKPEKAPGTHE